jgi:hypothetical protein
MTWILGGAAAWLLVSVLAGLVIGTSITVEERAAAMAAESLPWAEERGPSDGSVRPAAGRVPGPRTSSRVPAD